jgi:hypothetical protein
MTQEQNAKETEISANVKIRAQKHKDVHFWNEKIY